MIKYCHYKYVLLSQIKVRKQSAGTKFFTSRFLNINRGEEVLYIEALDLKYKWEDVSQQSEHMGIDSLTNEAMIMQMNETMEILKSYISVQRLMILQIKRQYGKAFRKGGERTGAFDWEKGYHGDFLTRKVILHFVFFCEWQNQWDLAYRLEENITLSRRNLKKS